MIKTHTNSYFLAALLLSGCASLSYEQGVMPNTQYDQSLYPAPYETPGMVTTTDFLPSNLMRTDAYQIDPQAYNDGEMNIYRIGTPTHMYTVTGTSQVLITLAEIEAMEKLKAISTVGTMANAVKDRTTNLVETPARAVSGISDRVGDAKKVEDKLNTVPSGITEISSTLTEGAIELTNTGRRIAFSAAGTKCANVKSCVYKTGADIWSGVNSLMGKHNAARELHDAVGTDYYTDNKVLRRQVDRLSYADSYISTAVKYGFTASGLALLDPLATGVGYYNNAEFVASYQDAYTDRNHEKTAILNWGADEATVNALYKNKAYNHQRRTLLFNALSNLSTPEYRVKFVEKAAHVPNRAEGDNYIEITTHLAKLAQTGQIKAYVTNTGAAIVLNQDDHLILPFAADYLKFIPESDTILQHYHTLVKSNPAYRGADIHMLGHASAKFIAQAKKLGIDVQSYNVMNYEP